MYSENSAQKYIEMMFDFEILKIEKKLTIWNVELLSRQPWDNLFYRGEFLTEDIINIRCITPCPNCFLSWFNICFADFEKNNLSDLVKEKFISKEIIVENQMSEYTLLTDGSLYFTTKLGCKANYSLVICRKCQTKHLLILGLSETQPCLYAGQIHGIWRLR
jgi:hypothetical protein